MSAFYPYSLSVCVAAEPADAPSTSPHSTLDVITPRTWSAPPSRAASLEPQQMMAPIMEQQQPQPQQQQMLRDVVDVRCVRASGVDWIGPRRAGVHACSGLGCPQALQTSKAPG